MHSRILILSILISDACFSQTFDFLKDFDTGKWITFSFVRTGYPTGVFMDTTSRFEDFAGSINVSIDSITILDSIRLLHLTLRKTGTETVKTSKRIVSIRGVDTTYNKTITEYLILNYRSGYHRIHGWIIPDTVQRVPLCPNEEDSTIYYQYPYYFRYYSFPTIDTLDIRGDTLVLQNRWTDCLDNGFKSEFRLTINDGFFRLSTFLFNYFGWSETEDYAKTNVTGLERIKQAVNPCFLYPNFPNPFNPSTHIRYQLATPGHVRVEVLDLLGRTIRVLADHYESPGTHEVVFEAHELPSGVYFCSFKTDDFVQSRKLLLIR